MRLEVRRSSAPTSAAHEGRRKVAHVMDRDVLWLPEDMPLERAAQELVARRAMGAPVCTRDGAVVGVVSIGDIVELFGALGDVASVRDAMTSEVLSVCEDDPIERAVERMAFDGVHRLVVVDGDGRFAGSVTSMDVLRELARGHPGFPSARGDQRIAAYFTT